MAKIDNINMSQFSGGRNGEDDPTDLLDYRGNPTGECAEQINIRTKKNSIEIRPGDRILGTEISSTGTMSGLGNWGSNLVSVHNTILYLYSDDWYPIKTGLTADSRMSFLEYYNDLYCSNGEDTVFRLVRTQLNGALVGAETTITVDDASKFHVLDSNTVHADSTKTAYIADGTVLTGDAITYSGVSTPPIISKDFTDSPYATTLAETTINYDATGGASVVNLITAVGNTNNTYIIRKTDASANTITINGNGGETIDGNASVVLSNQWDFVLITSDGANYLSTSLTFAGVTILDNTTGVLAHADDSIVIGSFDIDDAPKGLALSEYGEKFWIGNVEETAAIPSLPWREYYSVTATASSPDQFYDFTSSGSGQEFLAEGGKIKASLSYQDKLLIGKTTGIKYVSGFDDATPPVPVMFDFFKENGPINEDCMIKVGADIVYFTGKRVKRLLIPEFDGLKEAPDFDDPILDILQEEINSDQSEAAMAFNEKENLLFLSVKTKNASANDLILVYSTETNSWWQEQNTYARKFTVLDGVTYYAHSLIGKVVQDNIGFTRDGASDITFYESRHEKPDPSRRFLWRHLYLDGLISTNSVLTVKLYVDSLLITEAQITEDDIRDSNKPSEAIGDNVVGDDTWGGGEAGVDTSEDRFLFEKWMPIGKHGKEFYYTIESIGLAQKYTIRTGKAYLSADSARYRLQSSI